jgi:DNA-binding PadR family transcriptional regulator
MGSTMLSELEELVLLAVGQSRDSAYGQGVSETITRETGRNHSLATIHAALYRLEEKGHLKSRLGGATNERGGRRKRLFELTNSGLEALRVRAENRKTMWDVVVKLHPLGGRA